MDESKSSLLNYTITLNNDLMDSVSYKGIK